MGTKVPFYPPSPCFGWGGGFSLQAGTRDEATYRGETCRDFVVRNCSVDYYCLVIKTGKEEAFRLWATEVLDAPEAPFRGQVLFFKKLMRTKNEVHPNYWTL